jgi:hypothetical protein
MRKKRLLILLLFSIAAFFIGFVFLHFGLEKLSSYLSKSVQIKANVLIVEGWLPENAIEKAYSEFKKNGYDYIITTGLRSNFGYYKLSKNGYLVFYSKDRFSSFSESRLHSIEIRAFSELEGSNSAHFNLFVNDSLVTEFLANWWKRDYLAAWEGKLMNIDSIMVQFDNDKFGEFGDRNLYVKELIIDNKISIPYQYNSIYDVSELDGKRRIINNFNSNAELARYWLYSMGIDSTIIKALPAKRTKLNRTLTSALAVRDWLRSSDLKVNGINIVSFGPHSRRTWLTYKKVLDKSYNIGIISLTDYSDSFSGKPRLVKTLREFLALVYYWFILIPY